MTANEPIRWHRTKHGLALLLCLVCFAGAVAAQRFSEVSTTERFLPYDEACLHETADMLEAQGL